MVVGEAKVLVRVDAGMGVGFGHLSRCLALGRHLVGRGASVTIATRTQDSETMRRIREAQMGLLLVPGGGEQESADVPVWPMDLQLRDARAVFAGAPRGGWDAVVVDHYQLDQAWEQEIASSTRRIVVIDDLANRPHVSDVVVDHNWYGSHNSARYDHLVPTGTTLLLGPRYAMLHAAYAEARLRREAVRIPPKRVLVSFGGTDFGKQTQTVLTALSAFPGLEVDVVLGTPRALTPQIVELADRIGADLHVALPNLVDKLAQADLVIGAGGTATWERLCMGTPAFVTTVSENQSGVTRAFHEAGITRWLGTADKMTVDEYSVALEDARRGNVPRPLPIVDGAGAARVSLAVLPQQAGAGAPKPRPARLRDLAAYTTADAGTLGGPEVWEARAKQFVELLPVAGAVEVLEIDCIPVGINRRESGMGGHWVDDFVATPAQEAQ